MSRDLFDYDQPVAHQPHSETSRAAAESIKPYLNRLQAIVLDIAEYPAIQNLSLQTRYIAEQLSQKIRFAIMEQLQKDGVRLKPTNLEELNQRIIQNTRVEGEGLETATIFPCAFCGAEGWLRFPVTARQDGYREVSKPKTCQECGRTAKWVMTACGEHLQSIVSELVQTAGPPQEEWYEPKARVEP